MLEEIESEDLPVTCLELDCNWKGWTTDCETEYEQESWEYPEYIVFICPKCGGVTEIS